MIGPIFPPDGDRRPKSRHANSGSRYNINTVSRLTLTLIVVTVISLSELPLTNTERVDVINRVERSTIVPPEGDGNDNATLSTPSTYDPAATTASPKELMTYASDTQSERGDEAESKVEYYKRILKLWMENYDLNVRPNAGGKKVTLQSDMVLASIGPVNDFDMVFTIQVYMRQIWDDNRLRHDAPAEIKLNPIMLEQVWLPDTYVKHTDYARSHAHVLPRPNKMMRVSVDGNIYYSARLTVTVRCPMDFRSFPMDTQICHLEYGSYGYNTKDMDYVYGQCSVSVSDLQVALAQYSLLAIHNTTKIDVMKTGNYSVLKLSFVFQRRLGFFMIGSYLPCTLIVLLSWVSFWLNIEGTPARVALGIMTVLNVVTLSASARSTLPKVPYNSAMDWFVLACFGFVFSALMEFAIVNFFARRQEKSTKHKNRMSRQNDQPPTKKARLTGVGGTATPLASLEEEDDIPDKENKNYALRLLQWCLRVLTRKGQPKSISMHIDQWSRVMFPLGFIIFNIVYWTIYLPPYMTLGLERTNICNCPGCVA